MDERLRRAKRFLTIAESKDAKREAYKAAANEIVAYRDETGETIRAIALSLARDRNQIDRMLRWHRSGFKAETPFLMDEKATSRAAASHTKKLLRTAPLEQIEQIISELPPKRQQAIAAAAGDPYAKAREKYDDEERRLSPADRKAREATAESVARTARTAASGFAAMGIVTHLEQAAEDLKELSNDGPLSRKLIGQIDRAFAAFETELEVAKGMAGLESERAEL